MHTMIVKDYMSLPFVHDFNLDSFNNCTLHESKKHLIERYQKKFPNDHIISDSDGAILQYLRKIYNLKDYVKLDYMVQFNDNIIVYKHINHNKFYTDMSFLYDQCAIYYIDYGLNSIHLMFADDRGGDEYVGS